MMYEKVCFKNSSKKIIYFKSKSRKFRDLETLFDSKNV